MKNNKNSNSNLELDILSINDSTNLIDPFAGVSEDSPFTPYPQDLQELQSSQDLQDLSEASYKQLLLELIKTNQNSLTPEPEVKQSKKTRKLRSKENKEEIYIENLTRFNAMLKEPASRHRERKDICFNDCRMIKLLMDEFMADAIYRKFSDEEHVEGALSMVLTKQNHIGKYNYHIISVTEIDLIENYEYTHCYELCKNIYYECTMMLHDDLINWEYLEAVAKYLRNIIACNYSFIRPLKKKGRK
ncbi:MAG: hypothetical protein R3Y29_08055 [bacterium]